MAFQRQGRASAAAAPTAPRTPTPSVAAPPAQAQSTGGFQRAVRAQVITNPVAAAQATQKKQTQPKAQMVSTGVAGVKAPTEGGLQGVQYAPSGGFIGHLGSDITGIVTGIPSAVVLLGKNVAGAGATAYSLLPGVPAQHAAGQFGAHVLQEDLKFVKGVASDYATRYGPTLSSLAHGHPLAAAEHFGSAFYQHPGLVALDVGGAVSALGKAAGAAGRVAARAAPETRAGQIGARLGDRSTQAGSARYREPKTYTDVVGQGTKAEATSTVERARRPYSANPITRGLVQKPAAKVVGRAGRAIEHYAGELPEAYQPVVRRLTREGKFEAAARSTAQDVRIAGEDRLSAELSRIGTDYQKTIRTLKPIKDAGQVAEHLQVVPHEADVVHLHLRGLLDQPGMTPVQARDRLVQTMRTNIATAKASGERTAAAEKNVARFAAIPEHYLNLETAPAHVQAAVTEGRALIDESQRRAVESGVISPQTAEASRTRAADVLLGGAKWDPQTEAIIRPTGFTAGPQARYLPDLPAERMGPVAAGKSTGRFAQERVQRSHGTLISRGNVVTSPNLPLFSARRVLAREQLSENVGNLIARTAYRHGAEPVSGEAALNLLRADKSQLRLSSDPGRVHIVSVKAVQHALDHLNEATRESGVDHRLIDDVLNKVPDEATVRANPKDYIAIPRAAVDEWRTAMKSPDALLRGYDSVLSAWKSGILAFTPRFYVNNLISNAALYGLAAGPDIRSLIQAARKESPFLKEGVIPERVAGSTIAREAGARAIALKDTGPMARVNEWAKRGFEFNQKLESFWRRSLYIHAAKKTLRDEGGKFRHLTQEEVADAVAKMPPQLVEHSIRTVRDFLGDYQRFNRFERNVVKRVIPFYSWLRFVGTLTVALPFRSPLRAEAMAVLSKANDVENPQDYLRPLYNRGRINLPGPFAMRSTGFNPFSTVAEPIAAVTGEGSKVTGLARALAGGGAGPVPQAIIGEVSGRDPFTGRDYSAPPGFMDSAASFGFDPTRVNPATGLPETVHATPGFLDQLFENAPFVPQIRQLLAGGRTPYDVASTWQLALNRAGAGAPAYQLYKPGPVTGRATSPIPYISTLAGLLGAPIQRIDPQAEMASYQKQLQQLAAARAATLRAQAKARARVGS
jgi:hypothetical protein